MICLIELKRLYVLVLKFEGNKKLKILSYSKINIYFLKFIL